jgi:hypothetical protein
MPQESGRGLCEFVRVERTEDVPALDPRAVDVAVLDMNHGWPNLGHDSLVHAVVECATGARTALERAGLRVRVLSYDVRRSGVLPEPPGDRHRLYLGTGGPGHIDPRANDGIADYAQGIRENPTWEAPAFALFDAVRADPRAALIAVCHTFGVLCRWSGCARPVLRGPEKGKCSGVLENVLSLQGREHPWFGRFAARLGASGRLRVLENRLFDLVAEAGSWPAWTTPIGFEADPGAGSTAVTMIEFARDRGGVMPRVFAVNHHPEIVDRARQVMLLERKRARGEATPEWYRERLEILTRVFPQEDVDERLRLTSEFTLLAPLRFHLLRQVRLRAEALGVDAGLHKDGILP